jgi:hypothetical protein
MGRANERIGGFQETYGCDVTATWLESLERSLAMMKEYQVRQFPKAVLPTVVNKILTDYCGRQHERSSRTAASRMTLA